MLRQTLADFEQSTPTLEQVEKIEEQRLALDRALRAYLAHISDHRWEP
jgi:exonuclease VII small subunit